MEKREWGLKQLPDGRWQFSWWHRGKYHRFKARTKTEAKTELRRIKREIDTGKYQDPRKKVATTFDAAVKRFLTWSASSNRPSTYQNDVWVSKAWLSSPHFTGKTLAQITGLDVELFKQDLSKTAKQGMAGGLKPLPAGKWRASWTEGGHQYRRVYKTEAEAREKLASVCGGKAGPLSKRAVDVALARLKRLFSCCIEWELTERNPAARVKLFKEDVQRVRCLTQEEETALLAVASPYLRRVVLLALNTGMRKAEIIGLRWQDVDFRNGTAIIPATRAKGRRDRHIYLNAAALAVLDELPRPIDGSGFIFSTTCNKKKKKPTLPKGMEKQPKSPPETASRTVLERQWRKALAASGVGDMRFHDLRHTFASRLVTGGTDLAVVRELMGHRDFTTTLRYSHLAPSRMKEAVETLNPTLHETLHERLGTDG